MSVPTAKVPSPNEPAPVPLGAGVGDPGCPDEAVGWAAALAPFSPPLAEPDGLSSRFAATTRTTIPHAHSRRTTPTMPITIRATGRFFRCAGGMAAGWSGGPYCACPGYPGGGGPCPGYP